MRNDRFDFARATMAADEPTGDELLFAAAAPCFWCTRSSECGCGRVEVCELDELDVDALAADDAAALEALLAEHDALAWAATGRSERAQLRVEGAHLWPLTGGTSTFYAAPIDAGVAPSRRAA